MTSTLRVEAPTDAQLSFIAKLCREQGWQMPGAVYSKTEASEIISAMLASTYDAEQYQAPEPCAICGHNIRGIDADDNECEVPNCPLSASHAGVLDDFLNWVER